MTDDRAALLAAVLASPRDDAPRLIYSDWLEDHGEEERAATPPRAMPTGPMTRPEINFGPDRLSKLIKLACTVEAVGGFATARRMLDALEAIRGPAGTGR